MGIKHMNLMRYFGSDAAYNLQSNSWLKLENECVEKYNIYLQNVVRWKYKAEIFDSRHRQLTHQPSGVWTPADPNKDLSWTDTGPSFHTHRFLFKHILLSFSNLHTHLPSFLKSLMWDLHV